MTEQPNHQRQKNNFKGGLTLFFICLFVALFAISDFEQTDSSSRPIILAGIPSSFDLRVLPTYKSVDFTSTEEGICVGGNFAKTISQTVADYYSKLYQTNLKLSAQQLLQCSIPNQDDICHHNTLEQINYALSYISSPGLSNERCYPFKPLDGPSDCSKVCTSDNSTVEVRHPMTATELIKDLNTITTWIGTNGPLIMVIEKHDGFNYYSGGLLNNSGQSYGLITLEVVGWKDKGNTLVAKSTFGPTWGINGYVHVSLKDPTIVKFIGLAFPQSYDL